MTLRLGLLLLCAAAAVHASVITVTFDNSLSSGFAGDTLSFSGSLQNASGDTVFLTSAELMLFDTGLIGDVTPFFVNAPLQLNGGENSGSIGLFTVSIADPFLSGPGIYDGLFTVISGSESGGQEFSDSVGFQVEVDAAPTPEPRYWGVMAVLFGVSVGVVRRRRS